MVPGPGGWGVLMRMGEHEKELFGGEAHTYSRWSCKRLWKRSKAMQDTKATNGLMNWRVGVCRAHSKPRLLP